MPNIIRYRWECLDCRKNGRWLKDPDVAGTYGESHADRTSSSWSGTYNGHRPVLVDNEGRRYGSCI